MMEHLPNNFIFILDTLTLILADKSNGAWERIKHKASEDG